MNEAITKVVEGCKKAFESVKGLLPKRRFIKVGSKERYVWC